ncbi:hypothetical protein BFP70_02825 [Thioclava sp. SK-1]|uniref:methyl-accepting chemotaxis protein n=1 Tax=Thioclava sp. SK-1 TaxID=1889770 RepID=UPI000825D42C|nr:methyl-accepting chemotaxis protein [Thioclava sp. SK-1]OCX67113.1 hypothetical protein BFP70_02825 [Thioclava sp. SK-1]
MNFLQNLKLGIKLPLLLVVTATLALTLMGVQAYRDGRALLAEASTERLAHVISTRADALQTWQDNILNYVGSTVAGAQSQRAMKDMSGALRRLGDQPSDFLLKAFVEDNPNPASERWKLDRPEDVSSNYAIQHGRYHPGFVKAAQQMGVQDMYLLTADGFTFYSMRKGKDFATNVLENENSPLHDVVVRALTLGEGQIASTDFIADPEVKSGHSVFLASPIMGRDGTPSGVAAFEIPTDVMEEILLDPRGLQKTGQAYVVDSAGLLHNSLRMDPDAKVMGVLLGNAAISAANRGEIGSQEIQSGTHGVAAMAAYRPLRLFDHDFSLIVEQDDAELFMPVQELGTAMLMHGAMTLVVLVLVSWFVARSVARPLVSLRDAMHRISRKDYEFEVPHLKRGDEVGDMAKTLSAFQLDLAIADDAARDSTLKGAAFNSGSSAMMMADNDFGITFLNPAMTQMMRDRIADFRTLDGGFDPSDLAGRSIETFFKNGARIRQLLSDSANLPLEENLKIGTAQFSLSVSEVMMPEEGRIGYVVEWRDMTEIGMSRAIVETLDRAQLTGEGLPDGTAVKLNENYCKAVGIQAEEFLGRSFIDFTIPLDRPETMEELARQIVETGVPVSGLWRLDAGDGRFAIAEGIIAPVNDLQGDVVKVIFIGTDVTAVRQEIEAAEIRRKTVAESQSRVVDSLRIGLKALSSGDLCSKIEARFEAEYEQLRQDYNAAVDTLASAMQTVIENALTIDNETSEISNAAEDLSRRTEKQAATLEETAAALDQLTSSVGNSAVGIGEADRVVGEARSNAETSGQVVQQAVAAMGEIAESSQKISRIISVIDDIAFQTNLLALNAGVEAARAGEAGRGFAVVASEVRALAQRSSEAAREIDGLISASSDQVQRGVGLVGQAGKALETILSSMIDIAGRVSEIAASSKDQSSGLTEINSAMNQLDQVTQQNAAMFEQTTAASHSLSGSAQALNSAMRNFKTPQLSSHVVSAPTPKRQTTQPAKPAVVTPPPPVSTPVSQGNTAVKVAPPADDDWEDF